MARGPERTTLEIDTRHDPEAGHWRFIIYRAGRKAVHESPAEYDTNEEARAAARDWLLDRFLR